MSDWQSIEDRLSKLKEDKAAQSLPTEDDLAIRLALLRGHDPKAYVNNSKTIPNVLPKLSEYEQTQHLLQQLGEEVMLNSSSMHSKIDSMPNFSTNAPCSSSNDYSDIATWMGKEHQALGRSLANVSMGNDTELQKEVKNTNLALAKLGNSKKNASAYLAEISDDESDEEATNKLVKKLLEESALEARMDSIRISPIDRTKAKEANEDIKTSESEEESCSASESSDSEKDMKQKIKKRPKGLQLFLRRK